MRVIPEPAPGEKFGRWTVVSPADSLGGERASKCRCDCGAERVVKTRNLRSGRSNSCGCFKRDQARIQPKATTTHGLSGAPEYTIWVSMRGRCNNPKQHGYERYGGRGIKVCERWDDFSNFLVDMGPRPSPGHSIDRIDGSKGYSPENCRWATDVEQNNNRKGNVVITYQGRTQTVTEWSRETGISAGAIRYRLKKGWNEDQIFSNGDHP